MSEVLRITLNVNAETVVRRVQGEQSDVIYLGDQVAIHTDRVGGAERLARALLAMILRGGDWMLSEILTDLD